jgi:capsular polysaccharide biosynthesis protein
MGVSKLGSRVWGRVRRAAVRNRRTGALPAARTERLGRRGGRSVTVLADAALPNALRPWLAEFSTDRLTVLPVDLACDVDGVVGSLVRLPAQDVIVIVAGDAVVGSLAGSHDELFAHLALHLRAGGTYVVHRAAGGRGALTLDSPDSVGARFVKDVAESGDLTFVTKRGRHARALREHEVPELLPTREPDLDVSVLEVLPAGRLELTLDDASYGPSRAGPWPAYLDHPEMTLRHYEGDVVSTGGMRLRTDDTILPESFRWPHAKTLRHPHYDSVTPSFVRLDRREAEEALDGDYYYVDCLFSGHFGHLTTEVLCRLWGWDRARSEIPGLKLLFHTNSSRGADGALERLLFNAYGIPDSQLVSSDRPVLLRSVTGASPMWHNKSPFYVHPDIRDTWARVTTGLLAGVDPSPHEKIFVSRGSSLSRRRGCRNQHDVERFFADRGYHVLFPESLPLPDQVRLFAGARVVAGFGGSAMFNLMHCRRLEAAVVISHHAYVARNEHLFTSVLGGQLHYFWQASDVPPPKVGRNKASSGSTFAFDFTAYGDDLARVLAGL